MSAESAPALPVANERGERLLRVCAIEAGDPAPAAIDFALVAAIQDGRVLLVHNRRRDVWELPGGFADPGEAAEACALREFAEETGQLQPRLRWRAVFVLEVPDDGRRARPVLHGALFSAELACLAAFEANAEIDAIGLWPATAPPPGTSAVDAALLHLLFGGRRLAPLSLRERGRG